MPVTLLVGAAFVLLGGVFFWLAVQEHRREQGQPTIARQVRLRLAFIFIAVGIGLAFLHVLTG
jgi:hypothetical protein